MFPGRIVFVLFHREGPIPAQAPRPIVLSRLDLLTSGRSCLLCVTPSQPVFFPRSFLSQLNDWIPPDASPSPLFYLFLPVCQSF